MRAKNKKMPTVELPWLEAKIISIFSLNCCLIQELSAEFLVDMLDIENTEDEWFVLQQKEKERTVGATLIKMMAKKMVEGSYASSAGKVEDDEDFNRSEGVRVRCFKRSWHKNPEYIKQMLGIA